MANITAAMVSELRARTSVGMMDCKKALVECDGDMERACDYLREKGLAKAAKKAERTAAQGRMFTYVHSNAKLAVLLELDCETDFVARTDEFLTLGHEIAMHIAAANPSYIKPEDVPADVLEHEKMRRPAKRASPRRCSRRSPKAASTSSTRKTASWSRSTSATRTSKSRTSSSRT